MKIIEIKEEYTEDFANSLTEPGVYYFSYKRLIIIDDLYKCFKKLFYSESNTGKRCSTILEHRENNLPSMIRKDGVIRYSYNGRKHRSNRPADMYSYNKINYQGYNLHDCIYNKHEYFLLIL